VFSVGSNIAVDRVVSHHHVQNTHLLDSHFDYTLHDPVHLHFGIDLLVDPTPTKKKNRVFRKFHSMRGGEKQGETGRRQTDNRKREAYVRFY
jgi:hypothetical protein